ncbi:hypothetical protein [Streptomyces profundus]|uniref:hypothetical protein n=1 Tax=Streptomyces profundus TaxID=2867410 RepID=UPI001D1647AE|nr:hypothetical protein [Streptomyces sp. MA3_2.13]UED83281.1 hypothetical protein K4G22_02930 [Streptomyces sp. MA3_2.13]
MSRDTGGGPARPRQLKRAQVGWPRPLRELKDLLYEAYLAARAPSLDEIAADIAHVDAEDLAVKGTPSRDTIRRCISSPDRPPSQANAVSVAIVLARRAAWDEEDLATRVRDLWTEAGMHTPVGRSIAEYDDRLVLDDLEVHPALAVGTAEDGLGALPAYVRREFDERLDAMVATAADGRSGIAILVGGSSTGKTRACWEAVRSLPDGWRLWHPVEPDRAPALIEQLSQVGPRTVVWLNEAQHYLLNREHGAHVAAGLREVLNDPGRAPVLVLGSIWHRHWDELTAVPSSGPDRYAQARQLVKAKDLPVPGAFTAEELKAVGIAGNGDPRLAEALARAEQGQITQYLAGGPALLERYRTAPDAARTLIEAAMDARRLGHGEELPLALLEAAGPGYLTDLQWDALPDNWQRGAWDHVTDSKACRGARSPLYRRRPRGGSSAYEQPRYHLAHYLEQHGRETRRTSPVPATLWDAFIDFAAREDLTTLAAAAQDRGLMREAALCYVAAVRAGHRRAAWSLAAMLEGGNRIPEALRWYRWCAESGTDEEAHARVAWLADRSGIEVAESVRWLRGRVETNAGTGAQAALEALAYLLEDRRDELNAVLSRHYGVDDATELRELGDRLAYAGDDPYPVDYWDDDELHIGSRMSGPNPFILWVGDPLVHEGRIEEAIRHYQWFSDESAYAMRQAVKLLEQAGRQEEAMVWLRQELTSGNRRARWITAELLARTGHGPEAERLRRYGVEPDGSIAQPWAATPPEQVSLTNVALTASDDD